jgi:PAS domain S-box-containing protein
VNRADDDDAAQIELRQRAETRLAAASSCGDQAASGSGFPGAAHPGHGSAPTGDRPAGSGALRVPGGADPSDDNARVVHELQVHQIELELQNEQLRASQAELDAARSRYFDLYDLAPIGYLTVGEDGLIIEANLAAAALLGVNRRHLVRQPLSQFIDPVDQPAYYLLRRQLLHGDAQHGCEVRLRHAETHELWARLEGLAYRDAFAPAVLRLVVSDITERKQTEEAQAFLLRCGLPATGEDFFAALARYLAGALGVDYVGIHELDAKGIVASALAVYPDGAFAAAAPHDLAGGPANEAVGQTVCCVAAGAWTRFPRDPVLRALQAEGCASAALWDACGRPIGLITAAGRRPLANPARVESLLRLVAPRTAGELERRRVEATVHDSHARLLTVLDAHLDPEYVADPHTYEILFANKALTDALGQPGNRRCYEYLQQRTAPCPFCTNDQILGENLGRSHVWETHNETQGRWYRCTDRAIPWIDGRQVRYSMAVDITERRQLEERVEQQRIRAAMADRLQALGELATGMAHELNQPLNGIRTFAEGLRIGLDCHWDLERDQLSGTLSEIIAQVDRASAIIDHMRVFARGERRDDHQTFHAGESVAGALTLMRSQLRARGIDLQCTVQPDLPHCWGHAHAIEQVVINLLSNARDALEKRLHQQRQNAADPGPDWLPEIRVTVTSGTDGGSVHIAVSDTGGGIPPEVVGRVFDPFFTTKPVGQGTGIGLAIAARIAAEHGGRIDVDNRPGHGVTFIVVLPTASDTEPD